MSALLQQTLELARQVGDSIELPAIRRIHLPRRVESPGKEDEFGFVFLDDGSVGPFYTSLDNDLESLWRRVPETLSCQRSLLHMIEGLLSTDQAERALALGAFNAMSHHVMRAAGYCPATQSLAKRTVRPTALAMVGYIRPMLEKLLQKGLDHVLVLERNPARVELEEGVRLSTDPAALMDYDEILCTASTLINDSLDEILAYKKPGARLILVGPSGSGLPDILLRHGVDEVGGFWATDPDALDSALAANQSWGCAGEKYSLSPADYPGVDKLLEQIRQHRR